MKAAWTKGRQWTTKGRPLAGLSAGAAGLLVRDLHQSSGLRQKRASNLIDQKRSERSKHFSVILSQQQHQQPLLLDPNEQPAPPSVHESRRDRTPNGPQLGSPRPADWTRDLQRDAPGGPMLSARKLKAQLQQSHHLAPMPSFSCPADWCQCVWKNGKQFADCSAHGHSLGRIPAGLDPLVQVLNISDNQLGQLPARTFSALSLNNLQRIYLSK